LNFGGFNLLLLAGECIAAISSGCASCHCRMRGCAFLELKVA
jgi:hypothetical protein